MVVRAADHLHPGLLADPPAGDVPTWDLALSPSHGLNAWRAEYNGLLAGIVGFGREWNPWQAATRGEVAQMLHVLAGKL